MRPGDRVLDACCGTGDLAVAAREAGGDGHRARLLAARCSSAPARKLPSATWVEGDLLALPFEDGSFDAATVGFGVRNVADLERGLAELRRVLVPGGRLGDPRDHDSRAALLAPFYRALVRPDRAAARQGC